MMGKIINKEDNTFEIVFNDRDIEKLIFELNKLKDTKTHLHFDIGDDYLLIHHEEDELLK